MTATIGTVRESDAGVVVSATIEDASGAVNLTGADVKLRIAPERAAGGTPKERDATIDSAANGEVSYTTVAADFDAPGLWQVQWVVTFSATQDYATSLPSRISVQERLEIA